MTSAASSPPSNNGPDQFGADKHGAHDPAAPASALTPPTSEDMNNKAEDNSSDLSDLEMDSDAEEEITPDHYYDGGKIPVFKPTMDQFRSFKKYVEKIDKYGMRSGIVKVIPPKEWHDSLTRLDELVKSIRIKNPITQEFMGSHGTFTQANIEKQRSYNLPEWKALTDETHNQPPAKRGERRRNQEKIVRGGGNLRGRGAVQATQDPSKPTERKKPGRKPRIPRNPQVKDEAETESHQVPPTPTSPDAEDIKESVEKKQEPTPTKAKKPRGRPPKGGEKSSVASRRMNNRTEAVDVIDEAAFEGFDYHLDHIDEFTPERCAELETAYWKYLATSNPMYAADMPGSLFTDATTSWNVAKLENLLDVLGTKVPGVNTAYLYLGMWKATFAWHLEDVDLYSINYIHFGAPKQWYSISQEDARRFEAAMRKKWPNDSKHCDQFLRHKTYLIAPSVLKQEFNIEVNKLVHHEGEFVITYPYGYHSGYNLGYNCAESVNFALESWLDYGRIARKCECESDSVWVDVNDIERKLRGEPTPEYYEETDDDDEEAVEENGDLPSPPASVAGKSKAAGRKRKRDVKEKALPPKKKKRLRIRIKTSNREPCVLCPNDISYEPLLPTDTGKMAHRSCALYTPETWVTKIDGIETAVGVSNIDRARLELKCNFCRSKRGACFQCASKKCTRAFHATCALAAGVQIDCGPVPTFGEDGTEYFEEGYDFRCRFHRAKRAKNFDYEGLDKDRLINDFAKGLKAGDTVQAQHLGGEVFGGVVLENRSSELTVLVEVQPNGDRVEIEWKWLSVLHPDDSQRLKPSPNAIPVPEGMNRQAVSVDNRQDGVPKMEDSFTDNEAYKWAEFFTIDMPPASYRPTQIINKEQVPIDLVQPGHLYYYMPEISTETKCKFTGDPAGKVPDPRADFLERSRPDHRRAAPPQSIVLPRPQLSYCAPVAIPRASSSERPYTYKPKLGTPTGNYSIDQQALDQQRNFTEDAVRRSSSASYSQPRNSLPPLQGQSSDHSIQPAQSKFPEEAYYSSKTLPAAFPGDYHNYTEHIRKYSGNEQTQARPRRQSFYDSQFVPGQQQAVRRPSFQQQAAPSAAMVHGASKSSVGGYQGFQGSLAPAPVFDSRDPTRQNMSHGSRPSTAGRPSSSGQNPVTPNSASLDGQSRGTSGDWTPPSQLYHTLLNERPEERPTSQQASSAFARPQAMHQSMQQFQDHITKQSQARPPQPSHVSMQDLSKSSTAGDQMSSAMHDFQPVNPTFRNGYASANQYSSQRQTVNQMGYSPQAPNISPLSDFATGGSAMGNSPYVNHMTPSRQDAMDWSPMAEMQRNSRDWK